MLEKVKGFISNTQDIVNRITDILDLSGGFWLAAFTGSVIYRILYGPALGPSEAAVYSAAIGCFAYSNTNGPKAS